jgi:putative transcriptional regulator
MSKTDTIVRIHRDGTMHRVTPDGSESPMPPPGPLAPMTEDAVHVAALADPDARPLTEERLARMRPVPRTKTLRRALGLTQEEFATRFQIPLGTLRDWEQGKCEPDKATQAYLRAIAGDAMAVQRALQAAADAILQR